MSVHTLLIAPNAFKGSISAPEMARVLHHALENLAGRCALGPLTSKCLPVADGGDDTLSVLAQNDDWEIQKVSVTGPVAEIRTDAHWLYHRKRKTGVIEAAQAHAMAILAREGVGLSPLRATSYGVGELIKTATRLEPDMQSMIVALGGSASTDAGLGALQALGFGLLDATGMPLAEPFCPEGFEALCAVALPKVRLGANLQQFLIATDTRNPLLGPLGSAYAFAPQKGASLEQCDWLSTQFERVALMMADTFGQAHHETTGSGAAGGLAYGLSYLSPKAEIVSGFDWLSGELGLTQGLDDCDVLVTGEGHVDETSFSGKAVGELLKLAEAKGKPVLLVCGSIEEMQKARLSPNVLPISLSAAMSEAEAIRYPERALEKAFHDNGPRLLNWARRYWKIQSI